MAHKAVGRMAIHACEQIHNCVQTQFMLCLRNCVEKHCSKFAIHIKYGNADGSMHVCVEANLTLLRCRQPPQMDRTPLRALHSHNGNQLACYKH